MKIEIATGAAKENLFFFLVTDCSRHQPSDQGLGHFKGGFSKGFVAPGPAGGHVSLHLDHPGTKDRGWTRGMWDSHSSSHYVLMLEKEGWCSPLLISKTDQGAGGKFCTKICRKKPPGLSMSSSKKILPILNYFHDCL